MGLNHPERGGGTGYNDVEYCQVVQSGPCPMSTPDPKAEARALLDRYWTGRGMPVDPVEIARSLGVQVLRGNLPPDVAGVLMKRAGHDPRIVVAAGDSDNRRRFTVAHELGHFVYRGAGTEAETDQYEYVDERSRLARAGTDPVEVFANRFAAELLMPEDVIRPVAKQMSAAVLADRFGVSQEAMSYRLHNLKLTRFALRA